MIIQTLLVALFAILLALSPSCCVKILRTASILIHRHCGPLEMLGQVVELVVLVISPNLWIGPDTGP